MSDATKSAENVQQVERPEVATDPKPIAAVDTLHHDEAVKILDRYTGDSGWAETEESKLRRKVDWKLMPVLCLTYGLQYYDKAMLSQAALFGLRTDLDLTISDRYSWSASIFYLGFIAGAYPAMILAQKFPVEKVASVIVTLWGLCLILTTSCSDYRGLYVQRFCLGLLESGISPMFMLIVGSFYKKNEQAMRMGIWYSCTGYVSIFSPLINYGFGKLNGGVSSWRYMFYFAGSLTITWGLLLYFLLPADPIRAKGFNERERYILVARLRSNNSGVRNTHYKMDQVGELALDMKFWLVFAVAFLCMVANGPISTFVPIIINGFGFSTLNSLLLTMPAGAYGGTVQLVMPYVAYKFKNCRTWVIFGAQLGTTLAAILLWLLPRSAKGGLLFAAYILPSVGGGYAVLMGLQIANTAGYTKRSIASSGLYIGYCLGNFVGPLVFRKQDAPEYAFGFIVVVITSLAAGILCLVYRFFCVWQNKRRDRAGTMEGFDHAYDDDLTDIKVYAPENQSNAQKQALEACLEQRYNFSSAHEQDLQESFAETYWEYCYSWCPVLDPETLASDIARSPLLANALATASSNIQPPLVPHEGPAEYYKKARTIFYEDEESDGLTTLMALSLFYWFAPKPPSTVHRHSSWWWTSVIIRHAQQMNLHREPASEHISGSNLKLGLRRRIWWTAFVSFYELLAG
ncbi:putative transporter [Colletotrichum gloeosporioides]|uniref:Putative transporter n=1 Tax=Colletotrichum gloeosporioides TaxID=474922 RepID=A0A8H4CAQ3_COLGL|nr:putative transporter [Colletotrichum gloeosporioides]KAF3800172.1 putative transporter [Colletotrichum gloeosporioides]